MGTQKEVDVNGHKIVAIEYNKEKGGTPVVFIHGITASINFWEPLQLPIFKDNYHWISLGLPGHYPSILPSGFKNEDLTADMIGSVLMKAIRNLVGEQPVLLVGHSTGGFAALYIAATYPEIVSGVISISGFAHGKWNGTLGLLQHIARAGFVGRAIFRTNIKILASNRFIYRIAAGFYAYKSKNLYSFPGFESMLDMVHRDSKQLDPDSLMPYFNRLPDIDIKERLQSISAPTLVLAGDEDPIVPSDQPHLIAKKISNSTKVLLHGSGHLPMFERPEEYGQAISEWIGENIKR